VLEAKRPEGELTGAKRPVNITSYYS